MSKSSIADGAVTSMVNAIANIQPGYGNTAPIQLELAPGLVQDEESVKKSKLWFVPYLKKVLHF